VFKDLSVSSRVNDENLSFLLRNKYLRWKTRKVLSILKSINLQHPNTPVVGRYLFFNSDINVLLQLNSREWSHLEDNCEIMV